MDCCSLGVISKLFASLTQMKVVETSNLDKVKQIWINSWEYSLGDKTVGVRGKRGLVHHF